ncbi:ubiquitin-like domain-containing protein [Streptomyces sp. NPDC019396]|uniref:ubiquitin-like domain-containing protein n=1 Tax=Streptomyces sp. NPDC019396 TaxID=3154687 RepID=UPI0033DD90B9
MSTSQGSHRTAAGARAASEPDTGTGGARTGEHCAARRRTAAGRRGLRQGQGLHLGRNLNLSLNLNLRRLLPQALVIALLAGGTSAFVAADKAVLLTVDGVPRSLHTFAGDVAGLLGEEGVAFGDHDIVAPAPGTSLADGDEIVVRYGRPVTLSLDGHRRRVWTTAHTVEDALDQLGVRADGAYLSVSRSRPISRKGLSLDVRTEREITVRADGRERTVHTNAATVREAVGAAGVRLGGEDATSVPPGSFPRDGQTITVLRIATGEEAREERVPYATVRVEDPALASGTQRVEQRGRHGVRRTTFAVRTVNGVREGRPRKIAEELVRKPRAERVRVGTRPGRLPDQRIRAGFSAGSGGRVSGAEGLDWDGLAACESGGRPGAVDPSGTYGGLYQFDNRTWRSMGGRGRPQDAPATEQTYRAKKLYSQRGSNPWPHCGRRLYR